MVAVVVAREGTEVQGKDLIPERLNHSIQYPLRLGAHWPYDKGGEDDRRMG